MCFIHTIVITGLVFRTRYAEKRYVDTNAISRWHCDKRLQNCSEIGYKLSLNIFACLQRPTRVPLRLVFCIQRYIFAICPKATGFQGLHNALARGSRYHVLWAEKWKAQCHCLLQRSAYEIHYETLVHLITMIHLNVSTERIVCPRQVMKTFEFTWAENYFIIISDPCS